MVLLALCQWSVFLSGSADESLWGLLRIPVATRACAGLAVLKLRPMGTSQYACLLYTSYTILWPGDKAPFIEILQENSSRLPCEDT